MPARILGIIGTVLLHSFVIHIVVLGTSTRKVPRPTTEALASTANPAGAESDMILIAVQPTDATNSKDNVFEEFISRGSVLKAMPIALLSPDSTPALSLQPELQSNSSEAESPVDSGDPAGKARLFGIYSGQIKARIERAWRRPRTAVNEGRQQGIGSRQRQGAPDDEAFRCQVRIIQDNQGTVREILLPQCNGSAAWQRSLVIAIQQASPLPAPPSTSVFSHAMTMNFVGFSYGHGQSDDDYESPNPAQVSSITSQPSPRKNSVR